MIDVKYMLQGLYNGLYYFKSSVCVYIEVYRYVEYGKLEAFQAFTVGCPCFDGSWLATFVSGYKFSSY